MTQACAQIPADPRYPDPGPLPRMEWLPLDLLVVDDSYQRHTTSDRSRVIIHRIAEEFSWSKFGPVTVAKREDGTYAVADGQHRVAAARLHPGIHQVPCYIIPASGVRDEARTFVAINRDRTGMHALQIHHAGIAAGEPDALHIKDVCDRAGIKIPRGPMPQRDLKPGMTQSIGAIRKGLATYGDAPVIEALQTLVAAYEDAPGQLRGKVISAVIEIFALHRKNPNLDRDRLTRVIGSHEAGELEDGARAYKGLFKGMTTERAIRLALIKAYNARLSADRRLAEE